MVFLYAQTLSCMETTEALFQNNQFVFTHPRSLAKNCCSRQNLSACSSDRSNACVPRVTRPKDDTAVQPSIGSLGGVAGAGSTEGFCRYWRVRTRQQCGV